MSSLRSSRKKYLSSHKDAINKALKCLTSTPNMTIIKLLHLQKLFEISGCPKGRVLLGKIYVPRVGYILNIQSSQYVKYKLLEVLANTCSIHHKIIDVSIEDIGEDKKLAEFIFCSFAKSVTNKNCRLQNTLLELLLWILFDTHLSNIDTSIWIDHLKILNYDFGSATINILVQRTEADVFRKILMVLQSIFELEIPDGTNMLERLFNTNNLVDVLLKKFYTVVCVTDRHLHYTKQWKVHYYWECLESWLHIISDVTNLQSFRRNPCYYDIGIHIVHILTYILRSFMYIVPVNDLTEFYVSNISQNGRQEMTFGRDATYRSITLLYRFFLIHDNLLNITEVTADIVNRIFRYLQYVDRIQKNHFLLERGTLRVLDYLEEYDEHFSMMERSYKTIPEEDLIWAQHHNISPNDTYKINFRVESTSNVQRNIEKCEKEVKLMNNIVLTQQYSTYSRKQNHLQCTKIPNRNTCKYEIKCLIH